MTLCFAPNLSMLYTSIPILDRFNKAAADGFTAVEFSSPAPIQIEQIKARVDDLGLTVALFDLPARDAGGQGILCNPDQQNMFRRSLKIALETAVQLNCQQLNILVGQKIVGLEPSDQAHCAIENLLWAAPLAAQTNVTLLIEPHNPVDFPDAFLHSSTAVMEIITHVNHPAVKLLYDVYHAQMSEGNLLNTIAAYFPFIGHIQIADVPGRCEPGTGEINFPALFSALERLAYKGFVGLEYHASEMATTDLEMNRLAGFYPIIS